MLAIGGIACADSPEYLEFECYKYVNEKRHLIGNFKSKVRWFKDKTYCVDKLPVESQLVFFIRMKGAYTASYYHQPCLGYSPVICSFFNHEPPELVATVIFKREYGRLL